MIINDFHLFWTLLSPYKTNPILVIDTNAELASALSRQFFQTIARWNAQVV